MKTSMAVNNRMQTKKDPPKEKAGEAHAILSIFQSSILHHTNLTRLTNLTCLDAFLESRH